MRQITKWLLGTAFASMAVGLGGCAEDQPPVQDPTAAGGTPASAEAASKLPDMPGGSGETKDKPAGQGQANPAVAAMPTAPDKGQPKVEVPIKAGKSAANAVNLKAGEASVEVPVLNVRGGVGTKNPVKRTLKKGEKVTIKECKAGWCQIGDGEWASGRFLKQ